MATPTPAAVPIKPPHLSFLHRSQFPDGFIFGSSSSAFQIEGAVKKDGRLPSIWDTFSAERNLVTRNQNWADGVDHYNRFEEDVKIMKDIGLDSYRFSISWCRILPKGTKARGENAAGIAFYNNLINALIANGIKFMVTLFHWDLPQVLEDEYGGFLDSRIVNDFRDYADVCLREFGDRVKIWLTLNEPWYFSYGGYAVDMFAPGRGFRPTTARSQRSLAELLPPSRVSTQLSSTEPIRRVGDPAKEPYIVGHHLLIAHGAAVKLFRENYQHKTGGQIGMSLNSIWAEKYSHKHEDDLAAKRVLDFYLGWFMDPLVNGDYPETMRKYVGSRLPVFTPEDSALVKGSYDFVGLNYYTANYVKDAPDIGTVGGHFITDPLVSYHTERDGNLIGEQGGSNWLFVYPKGIYNLLTHIKDKYNNPPIYITENGYDELNDPNLSLWQSLFDIKRVAYHHDHLLMVKQAIHHHCNVKGYYTWSLLDSFEWNSAFSIRFGNTFVDYENRMKRYPKLSSGWYKFLLQ